MLLKLVHTIRSDIIATLQVQLVQCTVSKNEKGLVLTPRFTNISVKKPATNNSDSEKDSTVNLTVDKDGGLLRRPKWRSELRAQWTKLDEDVYRGIFILI